MEKLSIKYKNIRRNLLHGLTCSELVEIESMSAQNLDFFKIQLNYIKELNNIQKNEYIDELLKTILYEEKRRERDL